MICSWMNLATWRKQSMDDMEQICCSTCKWLADLPFSDCYCCMNKDCKYGEHIVMFPNGEECEKWEKSNEKMDGK